MDEPSQGAASVKIERGGDESGDAGRDEDEIKEVDKH